MGITLALAVLVRVVTSPDVILEKRCLSREIELGTDCVASMAMERNTTQERHERSQVALGESFSSGLFNL